MMGSREPKTNFQLPTASFQLPSTMTIGSREEGGLEVGRKMGSREEEEHGKYGVGKRQEGRVVGYLRHTLGQRPAELIESKRVFEGCIRQFDRTCIG